MTVFVVVEGETDRRSIERVLEAAPTSGERVLTAGGRNAVFVCPVGDEKQALSGRRDRGQ
jgi:xanthine/CO dehydrogenase XdhC/CoxF family maturation factor